MEDRQGLLLGCPQYPQAVGACLRPSEGSKLRKRRPYSRVNKSIDIRTFMARCDGPNEYNNGHDWPCPWDRTPRRCYFQTTASRAVFIVLAFWCFAYTTSARKVEKILAHRQKGVCQRFIIKRFHGPRRAEAETRPALTLDNKSEAGFAAQPRSYFPWEWLA